MRIVGGSARGRRLIAPADQSVRPMADRVRESLFNILAGTIIDAKVLDLFAGTGALGLEALSRGAASAVFVEERQEIVDLIEANLATLGFADRARVLHANALRVFARLGATAGPFDTVFVSPPYALLHAEATRLELLDLLARTATGGLLTPTAIVVLEHDGRDEDEVAAALPAVLTLTDRRQYGRTVLLFLEPRSGDSATGATAGPREL